jgi:hypothetical protein
VSKSEVYVRNSGWVKQSRHLRGGASASGAGYQQQTRGAQRIISARFGFGLLPSWGEGDWTARDLR